MRVAIEAVEGDLARRPGDALSALADAAAADGADRDDWLAKALAAHGATRRTVEVAEESPHLVVRDAVAHVADVYGHGMTLMRAAVAARLRRAVADANTTAYHRQLASEPP